MKGRGYRQSKEMKGGGGFLKTLTPALRCPLSFLVSSSQALIFSSGLSLSEALLMLAGKKEARTVGKGVSCLLYEVGRNWRQGLRFWVERALARKGNGLCLSRWPRLTRRGELFELFDLCVN